MSDPGIPDKKIWRRTAEGISLSSALLRFSEKEERLEREKLRSLKGAARGFRLPFMDLILKGDYDFPLNEKKIICE